MNANYFKASLSLKYIFAILSTTIALNSCVNSDRANKQVFRMNLYAPVTSLDPAFARSQQNTWMVHQIFNGLVQLDDSLQIQPCIARSWEISKNGLEYLFHLKTNVHYQETEQLKVNRICKSSDFVFSFERLIDPKTSSSGAWIFNGKIDSVHPFIAINDSTLLIRLSKRFSGFLKLLSNPYCSVVLPEAVKAFGTKFGVHPIGTGPFQVNYYVPGQKLSLVKNVKYYESINGIRLPRLDAVDISFLQSRQNEFFSFISHDLDVLTSFDPSFKDKLLDRSGNLDESLRGKFQFVKSDFLNTEYIGFNMSRIPGGLSADQYKQIRKAISHFVDKSLLVKYLKNSIGIPSQYGFVPPTLQGKAKFHSKPQTTDIDNVLAPHISLSTTASYADMALLIQKMLKTKNIPLDVDIQSPSSLADLKAKGEISMFRGSWIADYPDAENYLSIFCSASIPPNGPNYFRFKNTRYDSLYTRLTQEMKPVEQRKIIQSMLSILDDEAPVIPLFYDESVILLQNNIRGWHSNAINMPELKFVYKL